MSTREALRAAEEGGLDLVEISPTAKPPVCRIMDYGKFLFELSKKQADAKKKQKQIQVKELKFDGRWRLSGQATQPDPFPESW